MFKSIFGMFLGKDGYVSSTKLFAFAGYSTFLVLSAVIAINSPEKFNYELFALIAAASSTSMRIADKWLNVQSTISAASAATAKGGESE